MQFTKMHGLGNDFIMLNGIENNLSSVDLPALGIRLCNRNFGIGADGLIIIEKSTIADAKMRIINPDGSEPEMCGNGIRCFAKYIYDTGITIKTELSVETAAGLMRPTLRLDNNIVKEITVDMGEPHLQRKEIPMLGNSPDDKVIDYHIVVDSITIPITAVSMGNPHCVVFVDNVKTTDVKNIGPQLETCKQFPKRTNVEFAQVLNKNNIKMRVWERGAGETLACGTGACAVAVAGVLTNQTGKTVSVELPGGKLKIEWLTNNHILMTGPAVTTFTGTINL